ncbi:hypothetical protein BC936DRAFT_138329 [Jimgerdemannia flammicorona]|uniref:Uncharacterized protein n=1 Tax=Jimgerdemannia flammicorona TaxID=994334 RepID=A0A433CNJ9_9FUNG|nr:hypothetical protein BC936DRAFT_138329 [Jimgerdemannia flammicorona]
MYILAITLFVIFVFTFGTNAKQCRPDPIPAKCVAASPDTVPKDHASANSIASTAKRTPLLRRSVGPTLRDEVARFYPEMPKVQVTTDEARGNRRFFLAEVPRYQRSADVRLVSDYFAGLDLRRPRIVTCTEASTKKAFEEKKGEENETEGEKSEDAEGAGEMCSKSEDGEENDDYYDEDGDGDDEGEICMDGEEVYDDVDDIEME